MGLIIPRVLSTDMFYPVFVLRNYGSTAMRFTELTGTLKVPGMCSSVLQFS